MRYDRVFAIIVSITMIFLSLGCNAQPPGKASFRAADASIEQTKTNAKANENNREQNDPNRKIIYTGTLEIVVKNLVDARTTLEAEMKRCKAYFIKTEIIGDSGKRRVGHFTIRVPADQFTALHAAITALGNPIKDVTDSQDVTEEFVDLSARVKNYQNEEVVLNKLLVDAGQRLEEIFKIREQISKNRLEVERIQGRLQMLDKMTSYSTLTVTLRELEEYNAPTSPETSEQFPDFASSVKSVWKGSLDKLILCIQWLSLMVIGVIPWSPLIALSMFSIWKWKKIRDVKLATLREEAEINNKARERIRKKRLSPESEEVAEDDS